MRRSGVKTGRSTYVSFPNQQILHRLHATNRESESKEAQNEVIYPLESFWDDYGAELFGAKPEEMVQESLKKKVHHTTYHYKQYIRGRPVYGSQTNVMVGKHGGVLSASGHTMDSALVDYISEHPTLTHYDAIMAATTFLQQEFGPLYHLEVTHAEPTWMREEGSTGETGRVELVYELATTARIDYDHYMECKQETADLATGAMAPLHPTTETPVGTGKYDSLKKKQSKSSLSEGGRGADKHRKQFHHEESPTAKRARCYHQSRERRHIGRDVRAHFNKQGMTSTKVLGSWEMPEKPVRVGPKVRLTTRRLTIFVNANSGAVLEHHDKDVKKFNILKESSTPASKAAIETKRDKYLRQRQDELARGKGKHPKDLAKSRRLQDTSDTWEPEVLVYDCSFDDLCETVDFEKTDKLLFNSSSSLEADLVNYNSDIQLAVMSTIYMARMMKTISKGDHTNTHGLDADPLYYSYKRVPAPFKVFINALTSSAYWDAESERVVVGVGMVDDDTIAHEWMHAYTEYTSGLHYFYASGALNEGFSDIFGESLDQLNTGLPYDGLDYSGVDESTGIQKLRDSDHDECTKTDYPFLVESPGSDSGHRWLIGEGTTVQIDGSNMGAVRDMWRPQCFGHASGIGPERFAKDMVAAGDLFYCKDDDNGGIHKNSGVPGHVYATMVDGGIVAVPVGENTQGYNITDDTIPMMANDDSEEHTPTYLNVDVTGMGVDLAVSFMWQMTEDYFWKQAGLQYETYGWGMLDWCTANVGVNFLFYAPNVENGTDIGYLVMQEEMCDWRGLESIVQAARLTRRKDRYCWRNDQVLYEHDGWSLCEFVRAPIFGSPPQIPDVQLYGWDACLFQNDDMSIFYKDHGDDIFDEGTYYFPEHNEPCRKWGEFSGIKRCYYEDFKNDPPDDDHAPPDDNLKKVGVIRDFILENFDINVDLPDLFHNFKHLEIVELAGNEFTGNLPSTLCSVPFFTVVNEHKMNGTVVTCDSPEVVMDDDEGRLTDDFFDDDVGDDDYYGEYDDTYFGFNDKSLLGFWRFDSSYFLDISGNSFDVLPTAINQYYFYAAHNLFSGYFPDIPTPNLYVLDLSRNTFTGSLPDKIFQGTNVDTLNFAKNKFEGELPSFIGPFLGDVDISENNLSGNISVTWCPSSLDSSGTSVWWSEYVPYTRLVAHENQFSGFPGCLNCLDYFTIDSEVECYGEYCDATTCPNYVPPLSDDDSLPTTGEEGESEDLITDGEIAAISVGAFAIVGMVFYFVGKGSSRADVKDKDMIGDDDFSGTRSPMHAGQRRQQRRKTNMEEFNAEL